MFQERRGERALSSNGVLRVAVRGGIARHQIVPPFALQHLADCVAAHGCLDRVLDVGYIDAVARGPVAIDVGMTIFYSN